jgi:uncharacterized protein
MFPRYANATIQEALLDTRVLAIVGPRQSGKSTLARSVATGTFDYITLDDPTVLAAAQIDPVTFLRGFKRAVIDEFQRAPTLTLALKQIVDEDTTPGRFIITGSSDFLALPRATESLAGRVESIPLLPLSQGEIAGFKPPTFIDSAFAGELPKPVAKPHDLIPMVLAGGYPEAIIRTSDRRRSNWHHEYVKSIVERDVRDVASVSRLDRMPLLFELLARSSGQLVNWLSIGGQIGLDAKTVERYVGILEALFLVRRVRAWSGNEVQRLVSTPKLHFLDSGLLASTQGLTTTGLSISRVALGPALETFVFSELSKGVPFSQSKPRIQHYRDKDQVEVDFILEDAKHRLVGIEVKASSTVTGDDFRGLRKLAGYVGDRLQIGIVLYDGPRILPFGPKLYAVPLSTLWSDQ